MTARPLLGICVNCGRPIPKRTTARYPDPGVVLRGKTEVEQATDEQVTSIRYAPDGTVWSYSTWDGRSYLDPYFDRGVCAKQYGYSMARSQFPERERL